MPIERSREQALRVASELPVHDATELTNGGGLAHIVLKEQVYTLRITRAGKLILTK
ncbi:MAG: hemin uptake protein HemP [Oceanicola sp.]|nr:hemin uptake protein HemP [Oceanicola sp.]